MTTGEWQSVEAQPCTVSAPYQSGHAVMWPILIVPAAWILCVAIVTVGVVTVVRILTRHTREQA